MASTSTRRPLGIYNSYKPYKVKQRPIQETHEYKVKDIKIEPKEYKVREYEGLDPDVDPLTGLPYNHLEPPKPRANPPPTTVPTLAAFGSPVGSLSRTLKMFDAFNYQAETTLDMFYKNVRKTETPPREVSEDTVKKRKRSRKRSPRQMRDNTEVRRKLDNLRNMMEDDDDKQKTRG